MSDIRGAVKTIHEILSSSKYSIDYYQREYKWEDKQVRELVEDLTGRFLFEFEPGGNRRDVANYTNYFLGSIIISRKEHTNFVVDGQQRLTTLTLLLIFLRQLQADTENLGNPPIDDLIYSHQFGEKTFNLDVEERAACMEALFDRRPYDAREENESVQNMIDRYNHIEEIFPEELRDRALPYFIDWLIWKVNLVEITAYSDHDAYTIFETMNDRGLQLSLTEMLKGYLLTNIDHEGRRNRANELWTNRVFELQKVGKETESDFFKAWLRSQHATSIRGRTRNAVPEDFERIGSEYNRWVRDNSRAVGLNTSDEFFSFIDREFQYFSRQFLRIQDATQDMDPKLEHVLYNAHHGFTLQNMMMLAPLSPQDSDETSVTKLRLVSMFIDIWLNRRLWNFRSIAYSTSYYTIFGFTREIRGLGTEVLAEKLYEILGREEETFASNDQLSVHQGNRWYLGRMLARITDYVGRQSDLEPRYEEFMKATGNNRYEIEHIWASIPNRHTDEFDHPHDFYGYRNRIGGMLLLQKSFNAGFGALSYEEKLPHYYGQNVLAQSLHPNFYHRNPRFLEFKNRNNLPFKPYEHFTKESIDERSELYRQLAELIWDPNNLLREVGVGQSKTDRESPAG